MRYSPVALLVVSLAIVLPSQAQAQDDLVLMTQVLPPNVMILMDNSGSMSHIMWHEDFDQNLFYDSPQVTAACDIGVIPAIAGSAGFCPGSGDVADQCPDSGAALLAGNRVTCDLAAIPGGCAAAPAGWPCSTTGLQVRFTLPDHTPQGERTRWSRNYLSWLFTQIMGGTTPVIPTKDRLDTGREVLLNMIDLINPDGFNENVLFGLTKFSSGGDPSGGLIDAPVSSGNKNSLISKIENLQPETWTPLAETLVDIGEYMSGDDSVGSCSASGNIGNSNPMEDWCRRNFVIIVTDGEPTMDDFSNPPGTADFTCKIGNADGDTNEVPDEYSGRTDAPPYQSRGTDWLDDVAYEFYVKDLRPDLPSVQNMVTYTVGFTIDHPLLRDTAVNSTGKYYIAENGDELADALHKAVLEIIERATSFTAASVPSSRTAIDNGFYVAWFMPKVAHPFWQGHLEAYRLSPLLEVLDVNGDPAIDDTGTFIEPKHPYWDTGERLLAADHPPREIFTTKSGARTPFVPSAIDAADLALQATELNVYPNDPNVPFADTEALADAVVNYLHGQDSFDDDRDTDTTELREAVLGDIFHSGPIVIGSPPLRLSDEDGFGPHDDPGTFLNRYGERDRVLYVGANDAMLHAIDAGSFHSGDDPTTPEVEVEYYDEGTGNEVFGWVPGLLLDKIKYIPRNKPRSYYYVDGSPVATDAWFPSSANDTSKEPNEWTTTLVTGMRQGGDGYLALDITDPSATSGAHSPYPRFLWEFDDASQPLGETWSDPILTRLKLRSTAPTGDACGENDGDGDCREQWVAIFGGGFRKGGDPNLLSYISDPNYWAWSDDSKAIFIVALDTGKVLARLAHDSADPQLKNMLYSIPSTPAVLDLDFDGFADLIYIGDTGGQLWKWDISGVGEDSDSDGLIDNWPFGIFFRTDSVQLSAGMRHYRSIFHPPSAAFVSDELVLAFGTGERTNLPYPGDPKVDDNNRFYTIRDPHPTGASSIPSQPYTEANLTNLTGLQDDPDPTDLGYYFVADEGEKFVTNHIVFAGYVITTSYAPDDGSGGVCAAAGNAYVYIFNFQNGEGFFDPADAGTAQMGRRLFVGVGVPSSPKITTSTENADVKLWIQTSLRGMGEVQGPPGDDSRASLVYWKQEF